MSMTDLSFNNNEHVTLCEMLDRILNKGAVVSGEVTISVAGVDLLYLGVQLILASIETAKGSIVGSDASKGASR